MDAGVYAELTAILSALQAFSISYLKEKKITEANKPFFYQVVNTVSELEQIIDEIKNNKEVDARITALRKTIWPLLESNNAQPDDAKFDDQLLSRLTRFHLQTVDVTTTKEKPKTKKTNALQEKIKLLEKSRIYIPPSKTATVSRLESKFDEIVQHLQNPDISTREKELFIKNALPDLAEINKKLASNTEIVLTSIQAEEINNIYNLFQDLNKEYIHQAKIEHEEEHQLQTDMHALQQQSFLSEQQQEELIQLAYQLAHLYFSRAKFHEAETTLKENLHYLASLADNPIRSHAEVKANELLAKTYIKLGKYSDAKNAFKNAAERLKQAGGEAEHITTLHEHAKTMEDREAEAMLKEDKDIYTLHQMQSMLQKSKDAQLAHIAQKVLSVLYSQLVDPNIKPTEKVNYINNFVNRWNKYLSDKEHNATKAEWYTPEMNKIIESGLSNTLRTIREMFVAQAESQQMNTPTAIVKAKTQAQIRAEDEAKANRAALLAKAEASRERALLEKAHADAIAKQAAEEKLHAELAAAQERKAELERAQKEATQAALSKARNEELWRIRKTISQMMNEAKVLLDKAHANVGKHDYKTFLNEEEKILQDTLLQFQLIKPEERIEADIATLAKCQMRLGAALRHLGKFNDAEASMRASIALYDEVLQKQNYSNLALANIKVELATDLGRLLFSQKNYAQAALAFKEGEKTLSRLLSQENVEDSFKALFETSLQQNKAYALLMEKLANAEPIELEKSDNMIETLYHYPALQRKLHEEENKITQHIVTLDKNLKEKNRRTSAWHAILLTFHLPIFKRVILLDEMHVAITEKNSSFDVVDKKLLKSYEEALINYAFVQVLKNAAVTLPSELLPFVTEIKAIRAELRKGDDVRLVTLGLSLEQKIVYLEYEKQLARNEARTAENEVVNTAGSQKINAMLVAYKNRLFHPESQEVPTQERKWSLRGVISALRRKRKSSNATKILRESGAKS